MFKIGDKVKFLRYENERQWENLYGAKIGDIFPIVEVYGHSGGSIVVVETATWNNLHLTSDQIELVEEKGEPKFERGDLVTCNNVLWSGPMEFLYVHTERPSYAECKHPINGFGGFLLANLNLITKEKQMKNSVNYHVLNDSLILNYNKKTVVISRDDSRFEPVLQCIRDKNLDDIPAIVEIERGFAGSDLELKDGILHASGQPLPTELNDRILKFKEARLPYDSLLAFWENLKKNPSFNSRKMLFAFLEHQGHPLTEDGCFIAYRGISNEFKDLHTGTFDNAPGSICEMPRDKVDDNPNNTCSTGLHVASFDYAKNFGPKLVEVKVNPADVVSVPVDYDGKKMRTCRFEVLQECAAIREELVYGHESEVDLGEEEEKMETKQPGFCEECKWQNEADSQYCNQCGSNEIFQD